MTIYPYRRQSKRRHTKQQRINKMLPLQLDQRSNRSKWKKKKLIKMYNVTVGEMEKSRFEIQQTAFSTLWWPCLPKELIIYHPALIGLSELCKGCFPDQPWNQTLILTSTHKPPYTYLTETKLAWSCSQFGKHTVIRLFNLDCLRGETTETMTVLLPQHKTLPEREQTVWKTKVNRKMFACYRTGSFQTH